jgi:hypothetical protein
MSNPVATIGTSIPTPADPSTTRKSYSSIIFEQQTFFWYADGEFSSGYGSFNPTDKGRRFFIFALLEDVINRPEFTTVNSQIRKSGSGFLTGRYSVMPKIFIPSKMLVDNGIKSSGEAFMAFTDSTCTKEAFNWELKTLNGAGIPSTGLIKHAQIGAYFGSQYISVKSKNDNSSSNVVVLELNEPSNGPSPGSEGWNPNKPLVVGGAFVLMLNITPSRPAGVNYTTIQESSWYVQFEFGDLVMRMSQSGALKVKYISGVDKEENEITVNLAEGKAKEGPPQQEHIDDKQPYIILVYPVWNGVIIMSGNQESPEVVNSSSTFIPMTKGRSPMVQPYSSGFDPTSPSAVKVGTGSGASNTIPNFGTTMKLSANNVRFELAYLPCFFSKVMQFDEWFLASDNITGIVNYTYKVYPIWTANGTAASLASLSPTKSSYSGSATDTSYWYINWKMSMSRHDRYAGEIFGSVFEIEESRAFPIKNGNGSFSLTWTGGAPGDPNPSSWEDYIQSISVNVSLDGSSGSISVDKYGIAGQEAKAIQSIGAITIDLTGGNGTVAGSIFKGLGMGVSEQTGSDGSTWEIPLIGLENKMEDIALINVPFFDGETVSTAVNFLSRYAGLIPDFSNAPSAATHRLSVSQDVNVARFDWKTGTSVRSALDDVMKDVNYTYVVMLGKIYVYELDDKGIPTVLGIDHKPSYPNTKIISENQQPEFGDLRNDIVIIGLERVPEGAGTDLSNVPLWPRYERRVSTTTPDIPWAKSLMEALPGALTDSQLSTIADRYAKMTKNFLIMGRTTIAGNANIKPYDKWGSLIIYSVSHSIDFNSKSWTTDLEFVSRA